MYLPQGGIERILACAQGWKEKLREVQRPWLCWCADEEWCYTQQQLVEAVGWTPVVGTDGRNQQPRLTRSAIFIDFAGDIGVSRMRPHFPLEFAFAYCSTLAYWHSDVLPPLNVMHRVADQFGRIEPNQQIGVLQVPSLSARIKACITGRRAFQRGFEVIGCTTAGASQSQFEDGLGWWRHVEFHPHATAQSIAAKPYWEFGVGIWFWRQRHRERFEEVCVDVEPYHYSQINIRNYRRIKEASDCGKDRVKGEELKANFDLATIRRGLQLTQG